MLFSFMNRYRASRGIRRNREPGTRKPRSWPESKQRMIVCWLTLQIFAASPVVNTVFMVEYVPFCELIGSFAPSPNEPWASPWLRQGPVNSLPARLSSLAYRPYDRPQKDRLALSDARSVKFAEPNELTRITDVANYKATA